MSLIKETRDLAQIWHNFDIGDARSSKDVDARSDYHLVPICMATWDGWQIKSTLSAPINMPNKAAGLGISFTFRNVSVEIQKTGHNRKSLSQIAYWAYIEQGRE